MPSALSPQSQKESVPPVSPWRSFIPIAIVSFASTLNASVINISLPVIAEQLHLEHGVVEWIIMSYLLAVIALLMIAGRLGDLYGRRRTYLAGILLFTVSSALCGFSNSFLALVISRTLQGVGAALMVAISPALIGEIFPLEKRGQALGLFGATISVGLAVGPAFGGLVTELLGWQFIFFLNVPFGLLGALLVYRLLRKDSPVNRPRLDVVGSSALALTFLGLTLALTRGNDWGWGSPLTIISLAAALVAAAFFLRAEARTNDPILDLKIFRNPIFLSATAAGFLAFSALSIQTYWLPFYFKDLRGLPVSTAGLYLMSIPLMMGVVAPISGHLSDRLGTRGLCAGGLLIQGIGMLLSSRLAAGTPSGFLVAALLVTGIGVGMFNPPNNAELLSSVRHDRLGNASGMMGLTRTLGMVMGVALSSAIFTGVHVYYLGNASPHSSGVSSTDQQIFLAGLKAVLITAAVLSWLGMVMVWGRGKGRIKNEK